MKKFSVALIQLTNFQQEGRPMRKFLGVAIAVLLLASVTFAASAAKPKATGDADWVNGDAFDQPANLTFNAISINADGEAKGSAIYTGADVTYTLDVKYLLVVDNTAWFTGTVTSVEATGNSQGCCSLGNWILFKVVDKGEPGIGADEVWGEDLTAGPANIRGSKDAWNRMISLVAPRGGPFVLTGGNIQVHK